MHPRPIEDMCRPCAKINFRDLPACSPELSMQIEHTHKMCFDANLK